MLPLSSLFGASPYTPILRHMQSVKACVDQLTPLIEAFIEGNSTKIEEKALKISELEHEADILKNDIRNALIGTIFLSGEKADIIAILEAQDLIADTVEDVAVLITLRQLPFIQDLKSDFLTFVEKNKEAFEMVYDIIKELPGLYETSFSGIEAEKVALLASRVSHFEHEADIIQRELLRGLFQHDTELTPGMFHQWQRIFEVIGMIANASEKLALSVRMTIDTSNS